MRRGRAWLVGLSVGVTLLLVLLVFGLSNSASDVFGGDSDTSLSLGFLVGFVLKLPSLEFHSPGGSSLVASRGEFTAGQWLTIALVVLLPTLITRLVTGGLHPRRRGLAFFVAWGATAVAAPIGFGVGAWLEASALDRNALADGTHSILGIGGGLSASSVVLLFVVVLFLVGAAYGFVVGILAGLVALVTAGLTGGMERRAPAPVPGGPWAPVPFVPGPFGPGPAGPYPPPPGFPAAGAVPVPAEQAPGGPLSLFGPPEQPGAAQPYPLGAPPAPYPAPAPGPEGYVQPGPGGWEPNDHR